MKVSSVFFLSRFSEEGMSKKCECGTDWDGKDIVFQDGRWVSIRLTTEENDRRRKEDEETRRQLFGQ